MSRKIRYRAVDVQQLSPEDVLESFGPVARITVGIDVAKRLFVAALCDESGVAPLRVRFEHPVQTPLFVDLLRRVQQAGKPVEVAMEPTSTYGDALRFRLGASGVPVFRVRNKHVHDAAELFDGAPSKHDGKDASVIAWLHVQGRSQLWKELDATRRTVRALMAQRELYDEPLARLLNQVEPLLARHFPEFERFFNLNQQKTPWVLLENFGSPAALAGTDAQSLAALLMKHTRRSPPPEHLSALLVAAKTTTGVAMVDEEVELLRRTAAQILHLMRLRNDVDARIEKAAEQVEVVRAMRPCIGPVTAAVVYAYLGDPREYASAAAFEKAAGLNLVESSSGVDPFAPTSPLRRISKRGAAVVRKYLFLAALRLIHSTPLARAWYQARRSFKTQQKAKAIVALQRKLCRALFHVAKGEPFEPEKLFDVRRLDIAATDGTEAPMT